ncbi:DUF1285 domain-containing protein [Alteromonas sp. P256]|uniref:DUF1285 domain-containing protein n=1 Tax=Alteromonas sp. P256 TaxID=3117399 RepID=UPI002FE04224
MDLTKFQKQIEGVSDKTRSLPPVEKWNPDFCGDINMTVTLDGRWFYEGTPVGRASLVKLFSSVLKREDDKYFLVTPVEKVGITVEDTPFLITQWKEIEADANGGSSTNGDKNTALVLITQTGDEVVLDSVVQMELRVPPKAIRDKEATAIPYVCVRRNLWARLHQNVYYQLLEKSKEIKGGNETHFVVHSANIDFVIGKVG